MDTNKNENEGLITGIPDHLKPEPVEFVAPVATEIAPLPDGTVEMLQEIEDSRNRDQAERVARAAEAAKHIADTMPEFEKPVGEETPEQPLIDVPADITESLAKERSEAEIRAESEAAEAAKIAKNIADTMPRLDEQ